MLRYALAAFAVSLALVGAVACGDDDSDTQTAAPTATAAAPNQEVCSSVADVQQAADTLKGLDPANTTVTELQGAVTDLQTAGSSLATEASAATSADKEALSSAVDELRSAVQSAAQDFQTGASPEQVLASLGTQVEAVEQAADTLGPDCPGAGGTTTG